MTKTVLINNFTLQHIPEKKSEYNTEGYPIYSLIFFNGVNQNLKLSGLYIEKQLELKNGYLLFLTYECPFEERLQIYYLSRKFKVLDYSDLFLIYTPGIFDNFVIESDNSFSFSFFSAEELWRVIIYESPRYSFRIPQLLYWFPEMFIELWGLSPIPQKKRSMISFLSRVYFKLSYEQPEKPVKDNEAS